MHFLFNSLIVFVIIIFICDDTKAKLDICGGQTDAQTTHAIDLSALDL